MAENEPNFAGNPQDGNPDVTLKVTDEQLAKNYQRARETLKDFRAWSTQNDDDELEDTSQSLAKDTSFAGLLHFLHHSFLPDLPDRDKTQATILLDSTRNDIKIPETNYIQTETQNDDNPFPNIQDSCEFGEVFDGGGQGIISKGTDKTLFRTVAIKSLRKEILDKPNLRQAFITEAVITAQLEHPAIVPIHGLFSDGKNGIHQVMKLINGHSLREDLSRFVSLRKQMGKKLSSGVMTQLFHERVKLLLKVCEAIAYAHSRGIIHCDLKPENIMIGEYGEVYVMDWGLARRFRDDLGRIIRPNPNTPLDGTPRYMPAEVFMGRPRDERSDIFALGLILFEMITLRHGFSGKNIQDVIQKIKSNQRTPIANRFGYRIAPDLCAIIDKATAFAPEDRYQHVSEFADDLHRYLDGFAVAARPENLVEKFFRAIRRYSRTLVILVLVSWGISGFFIMQHLKTLNHQTDIALKEERQSSMNQRINMRIMEYEHRLSEMDGKIIRSAIRLSNTLVEFSSYLGYISQSAGMFLDNDIPAMPNQVQVGVPIVPYQQITSQTAIFSPVYNDYVKPDVCSYQVPPGRSHDQIVSELERLAPLTIQLRGLVLNSSRGLEDNGRIADPTYALVQEGLFIRRAYIGVNDTHLHLAYPGSGSYPENYDNHVRDWYSAARLQAEHTLELRPIWGRPYMDTSNKQQVLTCSLPVFSPSRKFLGVAAFDIFFGTFAEQLRNDGNGHGEEIIEKFLCTNDGIILCHVPVHPYRANNTPLTEIEAELKEKLKAIFAADQKQTSGGYGHYKALDHGHWVFFHYAYIPGMNLYLIEKSSEETIFKQIDQENQAKQEDMADSLALQQPVEVEPPPPPDDLIDTQTVEEAAQ
ncbi:MAG: protein kinase [Victivallales bacterium]|nr:protein kinase [Victivallales bacterium]